MSRHPVRAVFLDRDGVLNLAVVRNGRPQPPTSPDELVIVPGAEEGLQRLRESGLILIVVTNQPDIARGTKTLADVDQIHNALKKALPLDGVFTCCHDDFCNCACRKPKPGLLLEAAANFEIDLHQSYMVGDRWRDIDAGAAAGCTTVLIDFDYDERKPSNPPNARVRSFSEAVDWILERVAF